jgi:hypothetical protein
MAILHYRLTEDNQSIILPKDIHSQSFIFRRAVIRSVPLGSSTSTLKGGVIVEPSHFSGFEVVSGVSVDGSTNKPITNNLVSNDILLAIDESTSINNIYFDMEFESEDIPQAFTVKTFNFDREKPTAGVFGTTAGQITSIDIYFQFNSLYDYNTNF